MGPSMSMVVRVPRLGRLRRDPDLPPRRHPHPRQRLRLDPARQPQTHPRPHHRHHPTTRLTQIEADVAGNAQRELDRIHNRASTPTAPSQSPTTVIHRGARRDRGHGRTVVVRGPIPRRFLSASSSGRPAPQGSGCEGARIGLPLARSSCAVHAQALGDALTVVRETARCGAAVPQSWRPDRRSRRAVQPGVTA